MLNYLGITPLNSPTPPLVGIVAPLLPEQKTATPITFIAYAPNADTIVFDFGDGNTASGHTVTHTYAPGERTVTVTCTATNEGGIESTTLDIALTNPMYVWQDAVGGYHSWMNPQKYMVLRTGISGLSDSTAEAITEAKCSGMGEFLKTRTWKRRSGFGFNLAIIGANHAEIEDNRKELIGMLANYNGAGKIFVTSDDGMTIYIQAEIAYGYPRITNGLPPTHLARMQEVELRFTSPDPFWYGEEVTVEAVDGAATINNTGNVAAPCEYECSADTVTNLTTNESAVKKPDATSIDGVVVTSGDGAVTATILVEGVLVNALPRFTLNSRFWMIAPGTNEVTGVEYVKFRPRWSGI